MKHFLDLETSGFDPWRNSVLSLAWVITDDDYNIIDEFYHECAPDIGNRSWSKDAERVHGFTELEHRQKTPPIDVCNKLLSFLDKYKGERRHVHYHAEARFDTRFLFAWLNKNLDWNYYKIYEHIHPHSHINTIKLFKDKHNLPSYSLDSLAKHVGITFNHHNALSDTKALVEICKRLLVEK
jgi:DNA polymerase III epsilon subunit-like protein